MISFSASGCLPRDHCQLNNKSLGLIKIKLSFLKEEKENKITSNANHARDCHLIRNDK